MTTSRCGIRTRRHALGIAAAIALGVPAWAGAQSTAQQTPMPSMPGMKMQGMKMPLPPAPSKPAAKKKPAATPPTHKPACPEPATSPHQDHSDPKQAKATGSRCSSQGIRKTPAKPAAMAGMDHSKMEGMDHSKMQGMDHPKMQGMDHSKMQGMDHSKMQGMDHSKMQGMDHSKMQATDDGTKSETMSGMDHSTRQGMEGMDHSKIAGMDPSSMQGMEGMDHSKMAGMDPSSMQGMDHSQMSMDAMNMQGGPPPPDARDPDYSDGLAHGPMPGMDMADDAKHLFVLFDNLESRHDDDGSAQAVSAQVWYGGDRDKLWLKLDGERSGGRLGSTRTEALWNRAIATYWGAQVGVRHDLGDGPARDWVAVGVQGLAPYWFDLEATVYVGQSGRSALRVEAEYELLLTQRLVLQPDVEVNFYGKNDPARGIGSGLSDLDVGLRLRYELSRKFAPYVGIVWSRKFGTTAGYVRAAGNDIQDTQLVAGIRIWF